MSTKRESKVEESQPIPIILHIETLAQLARKNGLNLNAYSSDEETCNRIQDFFGGITLVQSILFSSIFSLNFRNGSVGIDEIATAIKSSPIKVFSLSRELNDLVNRQILRVQNENQRRNRPKISRSEYYINSQLVDALWRGESFVPTINAPAADIFDLFKIFNHILQLSVDEEITSVETTNEIKAALDLNCHISFVSEVKKIGLDDEAQLLYIAFCSLFIEGSEELVLSRVISSFFRDDLRALQRIRKSFISGNHALLEQNLIQLEDSNFRTDSTVTMTDKSLQMLMPDDPTFFSIPKKGSNQQNLINHTEIKPKQLFFDPELTKNLDSITEILQPENYNKLIGRLNEAGMQKGIAILLHGLAGTGKTEFCYQLARKTKRDIFLVNIAETKSMYFGESEKKIKRVFDTYRKSVEKSTNHSLLLFNEADAVFGTRKKIGSSSIDQTENAIQNIILQEMEDFQGVMICTTNLTMNLDSAFERRFLYKVYFGMPILDSKIQIWSTLFPHLSHDDAKLLANNYTFSGGQISNIARKFMMKQVIRGTEPELSEIIEFCENETLIKTQGAERTRMGFIK